MHSTSNRWGLPEGYNATPVREVRAEPKIGPTVVVDKTAVQAANKTVQVLETVVNDLRVDNEKLKRENATSQNTIRNLETTIRDLEAKIKAPVAVPVYNTGGYTGPNLCNEIATPNYATKTPAIQSIGQRVTQATSIAPSYSAPVNPMTVFVEFLEELDIFQEYYNITDVEGISFDLLCNQYDPSDWICEVCTDDNGDLLDEWEEANDLWIAICESDDLDEKEAYVE